MRAPPDVLDDAVELRVEAHEEERVEGVVHRDAPAVEARGGRGEG